jgi:hypothetical protein
MFYYDEHVMRSEKQKTHAIKFMIRSNLVALIGFTDGRQIMKNKTFLLEMRKQDAQLKQK